MPNLVYSSTATPQTRLLWKASFLICYGTPPSSASSSPPPFPPQPLLPSPLLLNQSTLPINSFFFLVLIFFLVHIVLLVGLYENFKAFFPLLSSPLLLYRQPVKPVILYLLIFHFFWEAFLTLGMATPSTKTLPPPGFPVLTTFSLFLYSPSGASDLKYYRAFLRGHLFYKIFSLS